MDMGHSNRSEQTEKLARRIAYLINAFIMQTIAEADHDELDEWVCTSMKNQRLFEELTDPAYVEKSRQSIQMINDFLNPNWLN